jgi:hypothetical protein
MQTPASTGSVNQFRPAASKAIRPGALLIWKKQHRGDIVMVSEPPFFSCGQSLIWVTPSEGLWFETDPRFLFEYDLKTIRSYLAALRRLRKVQGRDDDLYKKAVSAHSKLNRWWKQIATAAVLRNGMIYSSRSYPRR